MIHVTKLLLWVAILVTTPLAPLLRTLGRRSQLRAEQRSPPPGTILQVNGLPTHVVSMGQAQGGPCVVLVAGAGGCSLDWQTCQPLIAQSLVVHAWDRPGFGFSAPDPQDSNQQRWAAHLVETLKEMGESEAILVGHSMGSHTIVRAAHCARKSDSGVSIVGLVFVDPTPLTVETAVSMRQTLAPMESIIPLARRLVGNGLGRAIPSMTPLASYPSRFRQELDGSYNRAVRDVSGEARLKALLDEMERMPDECDEAIDLEVPELPLAFVIATLTRWGEKVETLMKKKGPVEYEAAEDERRAAKQWVKGLGRDHIHWVVSEHMVQGEAPESVAGAVEHVAALHAGRPSRWPPESTEPTP